MNVRYTIHLEAPGADLEEVAALAAQHLVGATVLEGLGLWEGTLSKTYAVITYGGHDLAADVETFARAVARAYDQDCVLVAREPIACELIGQA